MDIKPTQPDNNYNEETIKFLKSIQPKTGLFQNNYSYACYLGLYLFGLQYCENKIVLDAASGLGYGSYILATKAKKVSGIDILEENVKVAGENYITENLEFLHMNAIKADFGDESFDTIVSIETFEHLQPEEAATFIREMKRLLKPDGLLIISTPNRPVHTQFAKVEDHTNEVDVDELYGLLSPEFSTCNFFYQRKRVLQEMKTFYSIIKADKLNLRFLIPKPVRFMINKLIAKDLTRDIGELLPVLQVHKANSIDDVKDAVIQVVVCQK